MSSLTKKLLYCLSGILAGFGAWPLIEWVISIQGTFSSYLVFTIVLGVCLGGVMGAITGGLEGISLCVTTKTRNGIITGLIVGLIGGIFGFLAAQGFLFFMGEFFLSSTKDMAKVGLPISRVVGWTVLGIFLGLSEGIRSASFDKIKIGFLGGLAGGLMGGVGFELLGQTLPDPLFARLAGFILLGFMITLFYSLVEKGFTVGVLKALNGRLKGREFVITQRDTRIGSGKKAEIQLLDYKGVHDLDAVLHLKKNEIEVEAGESGSLWVNDKKTQKQELKFEDVIRVGTAKFLFYYK